MLGQRIVTAVVLLVVLAATLASANPWWFVALLALGASCAAWEWLRLTLPPSARFVALGVPALLLLAMLWLAHLWLQGQGGAVTGWIVHGLTPAVAAIWIFGAFVAVCRGRSDANPVSSVWSVFAVFAVLAAWSALALFFVLKGAVYVVSLLALVWVADIAAYFAGRAWGKRKLAPRVSPGKTVAGAVAGVAGAVIWTIGSGFYPGTFGQDLLARGLFVAIPAAALLGILSIVGDLFESLLKRRAGRKDSSNLLPGHGGVYDRIDAVLPVAPVALLMSGVLF
ncbi:phosphatidate cytidylyltransferase [Bordetella avium]|uniref:Phosphatidate cytidylyltransferase n=1 Tax=Bordetella avium (strain 197N) TaxID=360910 RepID=Q2L156_BORA1|nr:phosphatidate cytidylyltransferase [Bordetella avium]AZY49113.1 phosphatidate cytidylyltransferase [Bordetella avium]AZY52471.1 phosphatidate cytidylyltransferase [Bordetella avium]RIQ12264.1 phosphatidate cytidylyltransferase [Bordetella avium]RIQ19364.1 phosphatidate cytidylyltransferase [Bordetella avium]RIQ33533.1 phosphatidate cytidylyltransferase [Bordetella avium]